MPIINLVRSTQPNARTIQVHYRGLLKVSFTGCWGGKPEEIQRNIASIRHTDFMFHLGDFAYFEKNNGISSGEQLQKFTTLLGFMPCPIALVYGNHEANIHGLFYKTIANLSETFFFSRGLGDYLNRKNLSLGAENLKKFNSFVHQDHRSAHALKFENEPVLPHMTINETQHPKLISFPEGYYSVVFYEEDQAKPKIEYIVLNTNTLPYDEEQRYWCFNQLEASRADKIVMVTHHPILDKTYGERRFSQTDGKMYLEACTYNLPPEEKQAAEALFKKYVGMFGVGHGDILQGFFMQEVLWPLVLARVMQRTGALLEHVSKSEYLHAFLSSPLSIPDRVNRIFNLEEGEIELPIIICGVNAHDHHTLVSANSSFNQVTAGGGGSKLSKIKYPDYSSILYGAKKSAMAVMTVFDSSDDISIELIAAKKGTDISSVLCTVLIKPNANMTASHTPEGPAEADLTTIRRSIDRTPEGTIYHKEHKPQLQRVFSLVQKQHITLSRSDTHRALEDLENTLALFSFNLEIPYKTDQEFIASYDEKAKNNSTFKDLYDLLEGARYFMTVLWSRYCKVNPKNKEVLKLAATLNQVFKKLNEQLEECGLRLDFFNPNADFCDEMRELIKNASTPLYAMTEVYTVFTPLIFFGVLVLGIFFGIAPYTHGEGSATDAAFIMLTFALLYVALVAARAFHHRIEDTFSGEVNRYLVLVDNTFNSFKSKYLESQLTPTFTSTSRL